MYRRFVVAKMIFFASFPIFVMGIMAGAAVRSAFIRPSQPLFATMAIAFAVAAVGLAATKAVFVRLFLQTMLTTMHATAPVAMSDRAFLVYDLIAFITGVAVSYIRPENFPLWLAIALAALVVMHVAGGFMLRRELQK
jgi:hypothetical protein